MYIKSRRLKRKIEEGKIRAMNIYNEQPIVKGNTNFKKEGRKKKEQ